MTLQPREFRTAGVRAHRIVFVAAMAVCAGACSSEGSTDWSYLYDAARMAWSGTPRTVTLDQAAAIPYATIGFRLDGSAEQILALATNSGGDQLWTSSLRIVITTRQGRIVRTSGFGHDLAGFATTQNLASWATAHSFQWTADFTDLNDYSVRISCDDIPGGEEAVTILGKDIQALRVDETCRAPALDWSYTNTYWVSPSEGLVWRSIQHIHPKLGPIEIETLRPPENG